MSAMFPNSTMDNLPNGWLSDSKQSPDLCLRLAAGTQAANLVNNILGQLGVSVIFTPRQALRVPPGSAAITSSPRVRDTSGYVPPRLAPQQGRYFCLSNSELSGQLALRSTQRVKASNFHNGDFREFGRAATRALNAAPLLQLVADIVRVGSRKQVIGIAAPAIVALVKGQKRRKVFFLGEKQGDPVSLEVSPGSNLELPVAVAVRAASPQPASISEFNFGPKSNGIHCLDFGKWFRIGSSHAFSFVDHVVRAIHGGLNAVVARSILPLTSAAIGGNL